MKETIQLSEREKRRFWCHLLSLAVIEIRRVAAEGNTRLAYSVADAIHNIPTLLPESGEPLNDSWIEEQIVERATMDGWEQQLDQWVSESMKKTKTPIGKRYRSKPQVVKGAG